MYLLINEDFGCRQYETLSDEDLMTFADGILDVFRYENGKFERLMNVDLTCPEKEWEWRTIPVQGDWDVSY